MLIPFGRRFENYVASELMARIHLWMDLSGERYSLFYIRRKDKKETDFLESRGAKQASNHANYGIYNTPGFHL